MISINNDDDVKSSYRNNLMSVKPRVDFPIALAIRFSIFYSFEVFHSDGK